MLGFGARRPPTLISLCIALLVPTLGCGDDSDDGNRSLGDAAVDAAAGTGGSGGSGGSDGGGSDAAAGDSGANPLDDGGSDDGGSEDAGACNTVPNAAAAVAETEVASAQPAPTGGILENGTYHLTKYEIHTGVGGAAGPTGTSIKHVIVVSGAGTGTVTMEVVRSKDGGMDSRGVLMGASSGTSFDFTIACGGMATGSLGYTVTGTGFQFVDAANTNVQTFTKQ
jgi:hypothetical protein